jgi:phosphoglycerate dehydrogenase-like enzyme
MTYGRDGADLRHVLYLQRAETIDLHRPVVEAFFSARFPGVCLSFSDGKIDDVMSATDCLFAPAAAWIEPVVDHLPSLRWIHFMGSGTDPVLGLLRRRPELIASKSSGVNAIAMAEFAIAAMLYFAKDLDRFAEQQRRGSWQRSWLSETSGRHLVILGAGAVAEALGARASSLGLQVTAIARTGVRRSSLPKVTTMEELSNLLPTADFLVCALPLTEATRGLIGKAQFQAMPDHAILVNISRGGIVDEAAVAQALHESWIRGAAVDVFEQEPLPEDSPLWGCPSLLITPHVAGTSDNYLQRMLDSFETNYRALHSNGVLATPVDPERGY